MHDEIHICQGDKTCRSKEKPSGKAKNLPSGHDTTKNTVLPYNYGTLLPVFTQGCTGAIGELSNSKTGTIRINDTAGTVCTTTHFHTCGKI